MTAVCFHANFPVSTDEQLEENILSDSNLKELLREAHGVQSKGVAVEKLCNRYNQIYSRLPDLSRDKIILKNKLDDISKLGVVVDPQVYISLVGYSLLGTLAIRLRS